MIGADEEYLFHGLSDEYFEPKVPYSFHILADEYAEPFTPY
jgi:hypothetical protein